MKPMPNKMTDNEIIKALECCGDDNGCPVECPLINMGFVGACIQEKSRLALDLIKHQKAEIEGLQKYHDDMEDAIYSFREDHAKVKFFKNEIKTEAYKEFAERLYKECNFADCSSNPARNEMASVHNEGVNDERKRIKKIVDNLLKEMGCDSNV